MKKRNKSTANNVESNDKGSFVQKKEQVISYIKEKLDVFKQTKTFKWLHKYIWTPIYKFYSHKFLFCAITAIILNLVIEIASRDSFYRLKLFVVDNFHMFLFSTAIITLTLCTTLFFKRRLFVYGIVLTIWICLGVSNVSMLVNRSNPLMLIDFKIMRSGMSLSTMYLSALSIIGLVLLVVGCIVCLVILYKTCPKEKVSYKRAVAITLCVAFMVGGLATVFSMYQVVSPDQRLPEDYDNCGFVYCLLYGIVDSGIEEPEIYDEISVGEINRVIDSVKETVPEKKPNVIVLQLESFMDIYRIADIELSENPHPYFTSLKEKYPHGMLTVNALGSCTANVEYEVLTSTDIRSYGFDEYPYLSFLKNTQMESIAYNLRNLGYATTAIHNHNGGFYCRNEAYANLGFERFIPLESFGELTSEDYTYSKYWARDEILLDQIKGTIEKTEGEDMILTVTVQCHSKYHTRYLEDFDYPVTVGGFEDDEVYTNMLLYYSAMLREEDIFIESLLTYLETLDEESIVMMYGDHLPTYIEDSEQLVDYNEGENPNAKYDSEYIVWYTDGIKNDKNIGRNDLSSFELVPYALDIAGIRTGNIMKLYHAKLSDSITEKYRNALAYDLLEGDKYYFGGKSPYETIDMEIGLTPIKISGYKVEDEKLYVEGEGFTPRTEVYINGNRYSTTYVAPNLLEVTEQVTIKNGDSLTVRLITSDLKLLDESEPFAVGNLSVGQQVTANEGEYGIHFAIVSALIAGLGTIAFCVIVFVVLKVIIKKRFAKKAEQTDEKPKEAEAENEKIEV